ncbi:MAG TPA: bifunctional oligoribonuclease/PAP phosphatase NrnA [Gemmatimonadota bacterium]
MTSSPLPRRQPGADAAAAEPHDDAPALRRLAPAALDAAGAIVRILQAASDVVLTTHVHPDGDGLGSEAALAAWLGRRGARVRILNPDPAPRQFSFLATPQAPLGVFQPADADALASADALVILDTSSPGRLGAIVDTFPSLRAVRLCVDHHAPQAEAGRSGATPLAHHALVDSAASSTAELAYRLLREAGAEITPAVATPLYVGIAFDTGSFRYSNTTSDAHLVAADLVRHGVEADALYQRMFASYTAARMRLWGRALSALALEFGGRLAWMAVDRELLGDTGAGPEELDGLVEQGRRIQGVQVSVLFREDGPRETKVSFRSHGATDVHALAGRFGGGGHRNAAGATLPLPLREAVDRVLGEAALFLEGRRSDGTGPDEPAVERRARVRPEIPT